MPVLQRSTRIRAENGTGKHDKYAARESPILFPCDTTWVQGTETLGPNRLVGYSAIIEKNPSEMLKIVNTSRQLNGTLKI